VEVEMMSIMLLRCGAGLGWVRGAGGDMGEGGASSKGATAG
jgi:hypothetical protein